MLVLPKPSDIRGARASLNWKQIELAVKCNVTLSTISCIESEKAEPKMETLETIARVFLEQGIRFHPEGGYIVDMQTIKIFEGVGGFVKVLEDIMQSCSDDGKEVLFLGNDDKRSNKEINDMHKILYKQGIPYRLLISEDNDFILGPLEDYRKVNAEFFLSKDVIVIYDKKVSFCVEIKGDLQKYEIKSRKHITINDSDLSETFKKYFNRLWEKGTMPKKSTTKQIFFKKECKKKF